MLDNPLVRHERRAGDSLMQKLTKLDDDHQQLAKETAEYGLDASVFDASLPVLPAVVRPSTNEAKVQALIKASKGHKKITAAQMFYKVGVEATNGDVMADFYLRTDKKIKNDSENNTKKLNDAAAKIKREHDETIASISKGQRFASDLLVPELKRILNHRLGAKATNKLKNKASLLHAWREERLKDGTPCSDAEACEPVTSQSLLQKVEGRPLAVWWFDDEVHGNEEADMPGQWWHGIAQRRVGDGKLMVKYNESQPHHIDYCHSSSSDYASDDDSGSASASSSECAADDQACEACGCTAIDRSMLQCALCDRAWHSACLVPPLNGVPDDEWFCQSCSGEDADAHTEAIVNVGATVKLQEHIYQIAAKGRATASMPAPGAIVRSTDKQPKCNAIAARVHMLEGKTWGQCDGLGWTNAKGQLAVYRAPDLRYDLKCGYITIDEHSEDQAISEGQVVPIAAECDDISVAPPEVELLGPGQHQHQKFCSVKVKEELLHQAQAGEPVNKLTEAVDLSVGETRMIEMHGAHVSAHS